MKTKEEKLTILYIAGNGHSGSTLLDIIIGSSNTDKIFSAGELTFITRESIFNEVCSCGDKINSCEVWSEVLKTWEDNRTITYQEYVALWKKYDRNKKFLTVLFNDLFPSKDFKAYCENTLSFFKAIQTVTGKSIIVDSSKAAPRIAMLSRISELKVLHICRDFTGILNSAKRNYPKNVYAGYETDLTQRNSYKTLMDWILNNLLVKVFTIRRNRQVIHYKKFVNDEYCFSDILDISEVSNKENVIKSKHLLAGNAIRLNPELRLDPNLGFKYKRLTARQKYIASIIDKLFFFWVKK